jgi:hypothetical protein
MRRWLALALLPTALVLVHLVGLVAAVLPFGGTSETVAYGVLYTVELTLITAAAVRVGRSWPMRRAGTITLPLGMAAGLALWLAAPALDLIRDPGATVDGVFDPAVPVTRHLAAMLAALAIWATGVALLGHAVIRLAPRARGLAVLAAIIGGVALFLAVSYLTIRMQLGAALAPWSSAAWWGPAALLDDGFVPVNRLAATQLGMLTAVHLLIGTTGYLAYLLGGARPQPARLTRPVPEPVGV